MRYSNPIVHNCHLFFFFSHHKLLVLFLQKDTFGVPCFPGKSPGSDDPCSPDSPTPIDVPSFTFYLFLTSNKTSVPLLKLYYHLPSQNTSIKKTLGWLWHGWTDSWSFLSVLFLSQNERNKKNTSHHCPCAFYKFHLISYEDERPFQTTVKTMV